MRTVLILGLATVVGATSCRVAQDRSDVAGTTVVTSFYPLAYVVERIGGECVQVVNLTPPGVEPHDLELAPDDVAAIATADVVVYLGGGFQPALEEALGEATGPTVDVLGAVSTEPVPPGQEGPAVDPHVWLDPARLAEIADLVADTLKGPASACDPAASLRVLAQDLRELDAAFRAGLSRCERRTFVSTHAAFGYLADAYGLRQEAIAGIEPETEPSARRLVELRDLVRREGITTVFTEELVSPEVAETLASEAGVRTAVLSTIEGLTDREVQAGEDYVSLMEENLDALRSALDCA